MYRNGRRLVDRNQVVRLLQDLNGLVWDGRLMAMNRVGQTVTIPQQCINGNLLPVNGDSTGLDRVIVVVWRVGSEFL